MEIWNTKYCLTAGILKHEVVDRGTDVVFVPKTEESMAFCLCGEGREWHRTKDSAVARAEEVRIKKLASLERQIKNVSAIKF